MQGYLCKELRLREFTYCLFEDRKGDLKLFPFCNQAVTFDIKNYNRSLLQKFGFAYIHYLNPIWVKTCYLGMLHMNLKT